MPTLLDVQRAVAASLVRRDDGAVVPHVVADGLEPAARLNIYRNTFVATLTTALGFSFPAVRKLVGEEFFAGAARLFIEEEPPHSAYLNDYGGGFPAFLAGFGPAASVPYLADVAALEWAVNCALNAPDIPPLDPGALAAIDPAMLGSIIVVRHPSVTLLRSEYPVDAIWHAVLAEDDAAMSRIDLAAGPARLLVQRGETGLSLISCTEPAWRFATELFGGKPLQSVIAATPEIDAAALLADHLAAGRFASFTFIDGPCLPAADKEQP